jgi:hypothetical protein
MDKATFNQLKSNINKSGLSSNICCYLNENKEYVIINGNHRFKACLELGYTSLNIIYTEKENLSNDEIIALQISHNSITGSDDKGILRRLLDEISNIEYKEFAFVPLDDLDVEDMFSASVIPIQEHYRVSFVLYAKDMNLLKELYEIVDEELKNTDLVILADNNIESEFIKKLSEIKKEYKIKSGSIALSKLLEVSAMNITNITNNDKKQNHEQKEEQKDTRRNVSKERV